MLLMHSRATQHQIQKMETHLLSLTLTVTGTCHLLKLKPCMVIPQKASVYKTSRDMLKKTWIISSCGILFYKDSLPNSQNLVDNSGTSVSTFL